MRNRNFFGTWDTYMAQVHFFSHEKWIMSSGNVCVFQSWPGRVVGAPLPANEKKPEVGEEK
jgi:hypothetical protein